MDGERYLLFKIKPKADTPGRLASLSSVGRNRLRLWQGFLNGENKVAVTL